MATSALPKTMDTAASMLLRRRQTWIRKAWLRPEHAHPPHPASCRSLFAATAPRLRQPQKGPGGGGGGKPDVARAVIPAARRAAPLPYRSPTPKQEHHRQQQQKQQQPLDRLVAQRRIPLVGAVLAAGVLGFYVMPLLVTYLKGGCQDGAATPDTTPTGLPPVGAAAFDAGLDVPERIMGITRLRKRLAAAARGAVLEVAVGTGRNVEYYAWAGRGIGKVPPPSTATTTTSPQYHVVTSFTGVDLSSEALGLTRQRLRTAVPGGLAAISKRPPAAAAAAAASKERPQTPEVVLDVLDSHVRLLRADALEPLPAPPPPPPSPSPSPPPPASATATPRYDTVLQTFGLCSVADPVRLLANMAAVVQPGTGRILLLEHGRGRWGFVNALLDRYAGRHCARFGCWWNRDLEAVLVQAQAAVPGLEVVTVARPGLFQFGTLWWVELRVRETGGVAPAAAASK